MAVQLYDYQSECAESIENQFSSGKKRTLAVLATGCGKTVIFLYLVNKWARSGKRVLILAHRRELIHQPLEKASHFFPELRKKMGVVMAKEDDPKAQVVVATVQTATRDQKRLEAMGKFDYVILDECHHGTAKSYLQLVAHYPNAKWLGVTATPFRTDGNSLAEVFDSVAYRFPITAAIDRSALVPFDAYGFSLPISVEGVTETMDGWEEKSLGDLLSASNVLEIVYEKWHQYCKDRRTLCFTSSVSQAHATALYFKQHGVEAYAVDGTTPKAARDNILTLFRQGKIQVVCNCQVWTEGVDVPEASAAMMVCPTKSDLAYVQKLGRVLRTFEGKKDAIVLDFAPLEDRNVIMAGDILGVPRSVKQAKEKAEKSGIMVRAARVDNSGIVVNIDPDSLMVEVLKYLRRGSLAWTVTDSLAVAPISEALMLAVELPNPERVAKADPIRKTKKWDERMERLYQYIQKHRLWVCTKSSNFWNANYVNDFKMIDEAIDLGEKMVGSEFQPALAKRKRKWRSNPISEPQMNYIKRLGITPPEGCTSGQAAQLISHELARRAIERARPSTEVMIMDGDIGGK